MNAIHELSHMWQIANLIFPFTSIHLWLLKLKMFMAFSILLPFFIFDVCTHKTHVYLLQKNFVCAYAPKSRIHNNKTKHSFSPAHYSSLRFNSVCQTRHSLSSLPVHCLVILLNFPFVFHFPRHFSEMAFKQNSYLPVTTRCLWFTPVKPNQHNRKYIRFLMWYCFAHS